MTDREVDSRVSGIQLPLPLLDPPVSISGVPTRLLAPVIEPVPGGTTVWHYTDAAGAIGMMTEGRVRATSVLCLNDEAEFHYGERLVHELIEGILGSGQLEPYQEAHLVEVESSLKSVLDRYPLFIFCASEAEDSLGQWRGYSADPGYSLGFSVQDLVVLDRHSPPRSLDPLPHLAPRWGRVLYEKNAQHQLLLRGLSYCAAAASRDDSNGSPATSEPPVPPTNASGAEDVYGGYRPENAAATLMSLLVFCKHPSFADEQEVRLVATSPPDSRAVEFRQSRFGVTPFVSLGVPPPEAEGRVWTAPLCDPYLPDHVMIGPTPHREPAFHGASQLLRRAGLDFDPTHSASPFR